MQRFQGSIGLFAAACALVLAVGGCQNPQAVGSLSTPDASPAAIAGMESAIVASFATCKDKRHVRTHYVPQIKISLDRDGAFASPPVLVNPSNRFEDRKAGAAALRAVERCNPVAVVRSYPAYYPYWHAYILNFEPG